MDGVRFDVVHATTLATLLTLALCWVPLPPLWIIGATVTTSAYAVALLDARVRRWWL